VHALGQVANFRVTTRLDPPGLQRALNALLPPDIRVLRLEEAADSFHARYDCRSKCYLYRLTSGPVPPVFDRGHAWHQPSRPDVEAMRRGREALLGRHDFRAFARKMPVSRNPVKCLLSLDIREDRNYILFALEADGFLYTMARSIVGTLLEVGSGKRDPNEVASILASRDRSQAGPPAPARGLFLAHVRYAPP